MGCTFLTSFCAIHAISSTSFLDWPTLVLGPSIVQYKNPHIHAVAWTNAWQYITLLLLPMCTAQCFLPDGCLNDGLCTAPGNCSCAFGWEGKQCEQGNL